MAAEMLRNQLERVAADMGWAGEPEVQLERPRNPEHGDLATNLALILARRVGRPPREVADAILERLDLPAAGVATAEVAGPGFINFRLQHAVLQQRLAEILAADRAFGRSARGAGTRIQVEFVSANPTGPLHVAHGRGAALGDAIASLLEWSGYDVTREFYVNDAGVQVDRLGESIEARWLQLQGQDIAFPESGYHGEYVRDLARDADAEAGDRLRAMQPAERRAWLRDWAVARLLAEQDRDLREFRVYFDSFFSESSLYAEEKIADTLRDLRDRGLTYEAEGAEWL